jgi:integrase
MAKNKVGLYLSVAIAKRQKYVPIVSTGNNKYKAGWGFVLGVPTEFPNPTYVLRYTDNSRRVWETVGKELDAALVAKKRREQIQAARKAGLELVAGQPTIVPMERKTIAQAVSEYRAELTMTKAKRSISGYMFEVNQFTASCSKTYLDEVNREDLLRFIQSLRNHSPRYAPRTIYNKTMAIVTFLNRNGIKKLLHKSDWPKYAEKQVEIYTDEEITALLASSSAELQLVIRFFLATGCRDGEVMHACYSDLNYAKRTFTVQAKPAYEWTPKTEEGTRAIPIGDGLLGELRIRQGDGDVNRLIFPARNGGPEGHFLRMVQDAAGRAGLTCKVELHKFRKTYATDQLREGTDPPTLRKLLGHKDLTVILNYLATVRLDSPAARAKANRADRFAQPAIVAG